MISNIAFRQMLQLCMILQFQKFLQDLDIIKIIFFSFGINYENYGTFNGRDEYGNSTNTFSASQSQYLFGYAIHISNHLSLGTNIIYLTNSIADSNYSTVNYQYGILLSTKDK